MQFIEVQITFVGMTQVKKTRNKHESGLEWYPLQTNRTCNAKAVTMAETCWRKSMNCARSRHILDLLL